MKKYETWAIFFKRINFTNGMQLYKDLKLQYNKSNSKDIHMKNKSKVTYFNENQKAK
jgi:hypothetical protein